MADLPEQFAPEDVEDVELDEVMGNIISNLEYDHVPFEVKKNDPNEGDSFVLAYCNDGTIKITINRDT